SHKASTRNHSYKRKSRVSRVVVIGSPGGRLHDGHRRAQLGDQGPRGRVAVVAPDLGLGEHERAARLEDMCIAGPEASPALPLTLPPEIRGREGPGSAGPEASPALPLTLPPEIRGREGPGSAGPEPAGPLGGQG